MGTLKIQCSHNSAKFIDNISLDLTFMQKSHFTEKSVNCIFFSYFKDSPIRVDPRCYVLHNLFVPQNPKIYLFHNIQEIPICFCIKRWPRMWKINTSRKRVRLWKNLIIHLKKTEMKERQNKTFLTTKHTSVQLKVQILINIQEVFVIFVCENIFFCLSFLQ